MHAKKILIIENELDTLQSLESRLHAHGYHVITAVDGAVGYELAQAENPDLITLDLMLPSLNGYSICGFLKTNEQYRKIPIIVLSGRLDPVDRVFDESARPECYLTKPVRLSILLAKISELLKK